MKVGTQGIDTQARSAPSIDVSNFHALTAVSPSALPLASSHSSSAASRSVPLYLAPQAYADMVAQTQRQLQRSEHVSGELKHLAEIAIVVTVVVMVLVLAVVVWRRIRKRKTE